MRIGTSGWSYPSGQGTWNGLFYPATRSKRAGTAAFDELRFYAEHFDTVEVNTTFYGPPKAEITRTWAAKTPPGFDFSLKLYQKFTHPRMFRDAALAAAPGSQGRLLDLLAEITQSDIDDVLALTFELERGGLGSVQVVWQAMHLPVSFDCQIVTDRNRYTLDFDPLYRLSTPERTRTAEMVPSVRSLERLLAGAPCCTPADALAVLEVALEVERVLSP